MITSKVPSMGIEPKAGSWILLVGPRSLNSTMLTAIAHLGERCALRVLDGGNRFNAYTVARAARGLSPFSGGRQEAPSRDIRGILNRITVSRAFTCYQVLSLLESTPSTQAPFVVLDLLNTFYDESVQIGERKRLLRSCLAHLERLVGPSAPRAPTGCCASAEAALKVRGQADGGLRPPRLVAGGVVSVHPPAVPSQAAIELLSLLQASAADTFFAQPPASAPEPMRLF
jgi:hypothetical protein